MEPFVLHLLRHGEPEIAGRMMGRTDVAPTQAGIEACRAQVQEQVRHLGIEHVIGSDLRRAHRAATTIAQALNLSVSVDSRWREMDFGDWDGLATADIDQAALGRFWSDPDGHPPPGGERWSALAGRVGAALDELASRTTLIVTHGGAMRAALAHLCGFEQRQTWAFDLPYAALLSLKIWPGTPRSARIVGLWP
jgi:alpha-ribazole phosphatase